MRRKYIAKLFFEYCRQCGKSCCLRENDIAVFSWELEKLGDKGNGLKFMNRNSGSAVNVKRASEYIMIKDEGPFLHCNGCGLPLELRPFDCMTYPVYVFYDSVIKERALGLTRFVVTERTISVGTRLIDAMMIYLLINYGFRYMLWISLLVSFLYSTTIVRFYDIFLDRGYDLLGIDYLTSLRDENLSKKQTFKRLLQWILKRRLTIFFIGSVFHLDPDVVTLLLRDKRKGFVRNALEITFPSTVLSIVIWGIFFQLSLLWLELMDISKWFY